MRKLLILGTGAQGRMALNCAVHSNLFEQICFLAYGGAQESILGYPVIGELRDYPTWIEEFSDVIVAIEDSMQKVALIDELIAQGHRVTSIIHPTAIVSQEAQVGVGCLILPDVILEAGCELGKGVVVNTGMVITPDVSIADGVELI